MTTIERIIAVAGIALLVLLVIGAVKANKEFEAVCTKAGGTTVWDGRQQQCIREQKP